MAAFPAQPHLRGVVDLWQAPDLPTTDAATGSLGRIDAPNRLASQHFGVLVVGGDITRAGAALETASRGLRTALVEKDDFASGTRWPALPVAARTPSRA